MVVELSRGQLDWFRRKARATPNEILAQLVGHRISATKVRVARFFYPPILDSSPMTINPDEEAYAQAYLDAASEGKMVLGSIHSHPNYLPVMSQTDFNHHMLNKDLISGIVEVTNRKTRVVFWTHGSPLPCEFVYV